MIQLNPQEYFSIVRQLNDPTDTNTYYLQAYVRNARTDELLDTVELEDKGDQRFKKKWQVPADTSGEGFYITITVKIFTDSGYTTESMLYGRTEELFLVQQRLSIALAGGGGGGSNVNYNKIREIIKDEVKKLHQTIEPNKIDLEPILEAIRMSYKKIDGIIIPPQKEVDLGPIARIVERSNMEVMREVKNIHIPPIDLSQVIELLDELKDKNNLSDKEANRMKGIFENAITILNENFEKINKKIKIAPLVGIMSESEEKAKGRRAFI